MYQKIAFQYQEVSYPEPESAQDLKPLADCLTESWETFSPRSPLHVHMPKLVRAADTCPCAKQSRSKLCTAYARA